MRKFIIDTDTASDDVVAIITALREKEIKVIGITVVSGNVDLNLATKNALLAVEVANTYTVPVYMGMDKPLVRETVHATEVHGKDGISNTNMVPIKLKAEKEYAINALIRLIEENPYEVELITLGPLTNIAMAYLIAPESIEKLKSITLMAGTGLAGGNVTKFSEYNVYADAEALDIVLNINVPKIFVGWDIAIKDAPITDKDIVKLKKFNSKTLDFVFKITKSIYEYNKEQGYESLGFADPVAVAVAINPYIIKESIDAHIKVITEDKERYGEVILEDIAVGNKVNGTVVTDIDGKWAKKYIVSKLINE